MSVENNQPADIYMRDKVRGGNPIFRLLILALIIIFRTFATAQEIEPRAYSRAPVGTQTVIVTYAHQSGDVFTDAALPLTDVSVSLNSPSFGYATTFGLAGRQTNVGVFVPYIYGKVKGSVFEEQREVTRSGLGDIRFRITQMLTGAPALKPKEFTSFKRKTLIGASLSVIVPTGQYDPQRLVNIGSNRWAFKPEIGISKPLGNWTLELAGGVWLFTSNNNFFGGNRREQKPLLSLQTNLTYTIQKRMWVAVGGTYFNGGRTVVNHVLNSDLQNNVRFGATFAYPFGTRQSLKVSGFRGVTTRIGGNLTTLAVGWQYTWF
jgi:hypothetical protein